MTYVMARVEKIVPPSSGEVLAWLGHVRMYTRSSFAAKIAWDHSRFQCLVRKATWRESTAIYSKLNVHVGGGKIY